MKLSPKNLSPLENDVFEIIEKYIEKNSFEHPPIFYLEGGHFDPRYEVSDFSIDSLKHVLNVSNNLIIKYKGNIKIVIGILIDNLGLQCSETSCEISGEKKDSIDSELLPYEIEEVLDLYTIVKRDKMMISNERNCKNKTISSLKKIIENDHSLISTSDSGEHKSVFYHADDQQMIQLAEVKNDITWVAKCPAIMAQHYTNLASKVLKRFPEGSELSIIDFSEIEDINKVSRGVELALNVYFPEAVKDQKINIHNVFMTDFGDNEYKILQKFSKLQHTPL